MFRGLSAADSGSTWIRGVAGVCALLLATAALVASPQERGNAAPGLPADTSLDTGVSSYYGGAVPWLSTFTNRTTADGLGSNQVRDVYVDGSSVYVATDEGLSISRDGGKTFTTSRPLSNGSERYSVYGVHAVGSTVYVATSRGLTKSVDGGVTFSGQVRPDDDERLNFFCVFANGSTVYACTVGWGLFVSVDGGATFTSRTTANGLGDNNVVDVYVVGDTVYVATHGGLSISTDGGATFTKCNRLNGLKSSVVKGVFASGLNVYGATTSGLAISRDGGATFTNRNYANGLPADVMGVYAAGDIIYAGTGRGLSISQDGGATFDTFGRGNGLASSEHVRGVYVTDTSVHAAMSGGLSIATKTAPVTPTITITGTRASVGGKPGVKITGATTGLAEGYALRPWTRTPGQANYVQRGVLIRVDAKGAFTWQARTGRAVAIEVVINFSYVPQSNPLLIRLK